MSETPTTNETGDAPTVRFADFGLAPEIERALSDQGYVHPTPIQAKAIPIVLQGRDVMGAAQTGTGKTASFSLPIIQLLLPHANTSMSPARHAVRALVLTPTRELAIQVAENVKAYAQHTPLRSTVVFGGMDMKPQTEILRRGVEIVIATPGRLLDHVEQNNNSQNLMFSATFSPEIKKLASSFLTDPLTIEVARSNATNNAITQVLYKVEEAQKPDVVLHLIRSRDLKQVLVFSNTKIGASRLSRTLEQAGIKASAIHGDKTQQERIAALDAFKNGEIDVLVATDVAARGLDITDLPCVINYDLPYNAEDYVHRIGRTGRAGATGDALSVFSDKDERLLVDIEKLIKQTITRGELVGYAPPSRGQHRGNERGAERGNVSDNERYASRRSDGQPRGSERSERPDRGSRGGFVPRREKVDPWFLKPYEPASAPRQETSAAQGGQAKPKQKLAALLGGLPKQ
jgi:superfamily II DNA/RNA helicase